MLFRSDLFIINGLPASQVASRMSEFCMGRTLVLAGFYVSLLPVALLNNRYIFYNGDEKVNLCFLSLCW